MENPEGINLLVVLLIGTFAMLILGLSVIGFVLLHQRRVIAHQQEIKAKDEKMQQELLRATIQSQEEEQRRISRDLHDDVGPLLSAVKLKIGQLSKQLKDSEDKTNIADDAKSLIDTSINQVRNISHQLLPPALDKYGLAAAVRSLCEKMNVHGKLEITYTEEGNYIRCNTEIELALYRVIMELLNNVIKHSQATTAQVLLKSSGDLLEVSVIDNGKGFDITATEKAGLGLKNIYSRLKAIDAYINFEKLQPGTKAHITVVNASNTNIPA